MKIYILLLIVIVVSCSGNQQESIQNNKGIDYPIVNNIDSAILLAQKHSKEILLLFDCHNCMGSRQNHMSVLTEPEIKNIITQKYIFLTLYLDGKTKLVDDKSQNQKTIGDLNEEIQQSILKMSSTPALLIIDAKKRIIKKPIFIPLDREGILEYISNN